MASPRRPAVDARCAEYVALLEQGHALAEIAEKFGVARNAVEEVLRRRGLPHTMKAAVRAMHARNAPRRGPVVNLCCAAQCPTAFATAQTGRDE